MAQMVLGTTQSTSYKSQCGLDSRNSKEESLVNSCENGNELSRFATGREFFY